MRNGYFSCDSFALGFPGPRRAPWICTQFPFVGAFPVVCRSFALVAHQIYVTRVLEENAFPGYPRFLGATPVPQSWYRCGSPRRNPLVFCLNSHANQAKWSESSTKGVPLTSKIRISAGAQFRAKKLRGAGAQNHGFRTKGVGGPDVAGPPTPLVRNP